jgi:hypothetical protein
MPARPRRNSSQKTNASARARKDRKTASTTPSGGSLFSFTLDATTGEVVKVETLNAEGTRRKVPERQRKTLARKGRERVEEVLVEAFEAGIDCVLGDSSEPSETDRDAELRHDLVAPLLKRSSASRLLNPESLNRAILGTLMQHSATEPPRAP